VNSTAIRGRVVVGEEIWPGGTVLVEGPSIRAVGRGPLRADALVDLGDSFVVPGFVDLQLNGAFGVDVVLQPERLRELSASLVATGTTSYLPTVVTRPADEYESLLAGLHLEGDGGAEALGLHLEGPFINVAKRGAHPAKAVTPPDPDAFAAMLDAGPRVSMVTLAPEMPGAGKLISRGVERGVVVSLAHSNASFDEAMGAFDAGAKSVTHLFNAMSPLHHRDPGLPGAVFAHGTAACGIIVDRHHVHPEMVRLAYDRLGPERMYLVTDAMAAAGMGPGEHSLAGRTVHVEDGAPKLADGTLAGSALLMPEAVANVVEITGCTLQDAVKMASTTPARLVGANSKGRLAAGADADVVALSPNLDVEAVWVRGRLQGAPDGAARLLRGGRAREGLTADG
jgi:N-acetylglucosamine-6-phosphate deacetylase